MIRRYVCEEEENTWTVKVDFTKFDGMKLVEPESGTQYEVGIGPNEQQTVAVRLDIAGYGWAEKTMNRVE